MAELELILVTILLVYRFEGNRLLSKNIIRAFKLYTASTNNVGKNVANVFIYLFLNDSGSLEVQARTYRSLHKVEHKIALNLY